MTERREVHKVVAYITRGDHLLVFRQPGAYQAGIQVPAGTLEDGEQPEDGVMREASEETGLSGFTLESSLGQTRFDIAEFGRDEINVRHYFHLTYDKETPETWQHLEPHPSGEPTEPIYPFEFFWARMPDEVPDLIANFGEKLSALYEHLFARG